MIELIVTIWVCSGACTGNMLAWDRETITVARYETLEACEATPTTTDMIHSVLNEQMPEVDRWGLYSGDWACRIGGVS